MAAEPIPLVGDYVAALLDDEEFVPLFRQYRPQVFANRLEVFPRGLLSESEKAAVQSLSQRMDSARTKHRHLS